MCADRAYRSHLQPACLPCRRRKSRCKTDSAVDAATCLMCLAHATTCVFPDLNDTTPAHSPRHSSPTRPLSRSRRLLASHAAPASPGARSRARMSTASPRTPAVARDPQSSEGPFNTASLSTLRGPADHSHIVGPMQSPDAQLIASYLHQDPGPIIVGHPAADKPILFYAVRKHPLGYGASQTVAPAKCEVIERLIEPDCHHLLQVYFDKVHRCFPLLDVPSFQREYASSRQRMSPALLACLYVKTLVYWRQTLPPGRHCPDVGYLWHQANEALYSELYASPGMPTIIAILLNVSGRPLTSMVGNGILLSSAISLAHSLGLNRDCSGWDLTVAEKCLRTRLWWALILYDTWASVTYGTPPKLNANHHDVPEPTPSSLFGVDDEPADPDATSVYLAFLGLTRVLDVYSRSAYELAAAASRDTYEMVAVGIDTKLAQWEDSLPRALKRAITRGIGLELPGSSNLRLSYLYLRLITRKLEIDGAKQNEQMSGSAAYSHRQLQARQAAEAIVVFVQELDDLSLSDYWMSFNAFSLSNTVAFLLASALETELDRSQMPQSIFVQLARDMLAALRRHRERMRWDLGNISITQHSDVLDKIMAQPHSASEYMPDYAEHDVAGFPGIDGMFPSLWTIFNTGI